MRRFGTAVAAIVIITVVCGQRARADAPDNVVVDAPTAVKMPGPVDDVGVAGSGEKILLLIKRLQKIAVFDVKSSKITGYIAAPSTEVKFAGGKDRVVVALNDQNVLQSWNLKTLEKEKTIPLDQPAQTLAMGWASDGPALLNAKMLYDPSTLKPTGLATLPHGGYGLEEGMQTRLSGDGSTATAWRRNVSPSGLYVARVSRFSAEWKYEHNSAGPLLPTFDGSLICTSYGGFYTPDIKRIPGEAFRELQCVPAYHPGYLLAIRRTDRPVNPGRTGPRGEVMIYTASDRRLLLTLPGFPEMQLPLGAQPSWPPDELTVDKRYFFMPSLNKMITLPDTNDQLVVRNLDILDRMDKQDLDYLFVDSIPNRSARPGQDYRYQMVVRSRKGGVTFKFDAGPKGMTMTKDGLLKWPVPKGLMEKEASVIVTITDANGQTACHAFTIDLGFDSGAGAVGGGTIITSGPNSGRSSGGAIVVTPRDSTTR